MSRFAPELQRLLLIRGIARALAPLAVLWGILDWMLVDWRLYGHPKWGLIYALLTFNYVIVYVISWVAPAMLQGPWRIRPFQTFVLLGNAVLLPIVFKRTFGRLPWGFIGMTLLFFVGLYAATAILFYLQDKLPMHSIFVARRGGAMPTRPKRRERKAATPEAPGSTS